MKIECPKCHNRSTERLAMTWARGVSHSKSVGLSMGIFGGFNPLKTLLTIPFLPFIIGFKFLGMLLTISRTWTTSKSVLAAESEPPFYFPVLKSILFGLLYMPLGVVLSLFVLTFLAGAGLIPQQGWVGISVGGAVTVLGTFGIPIIGVCMGIRHNRKVWPVLEARWQRSFGCNRCGARFIVPEYDPAGENVVSSNRAGKGGLMPEVGIRQHEEAFQRWAVEDDVNLRHKGKKEQLN